MPIGDGTPSTPGTLLRHRPSLDRVTISCANLCKVVHACAWLCMVVHDMTVAEILKTVSKGGYLPSLDTVTISCASLHKLAQDMVTVSKEGTRGTLPREVASIGHSL